MPLQPNKYYSKNTNKKSLSTSSLSSNAEEKKTKLFISPNRFSVLAKRDNIDVNTSTINVQTRNSDDRLKEPSVYIKNVDNISTFIPSLMTILDSINFIYKFTPSYLIVHTYFVEHYNLFLSHLEENNYRYHSYQPDINCQLHIVIQNFHPTTAYENIIAGL